MTSFISKAHETGHFAYCTKDSGLTRFQKIKMQGMIISQVFNENHWHLLPSVDYKVMNKIETS